MTDDMISDLKCSSMVSAVAFSVCLCHPDVRVLLRLFHFSAAIDDALSNKL